MLRRRTPLFAALLMGCASTAPTPVGECASDAVLVVASDYKSSAVGSFNRTAAPSLFGGTELGGDPALASSGGRRFLIARDRDTIYELDRCGHGIAAFSARQKGEANVDPWDVAVLPSGGLLVPRYLSGAALVLDAQGAPRGTIDLSTFDADGVPDMAAAVTTSLAGAPSVLVVLDRLEAPTKPGAPPRVTRTGLLVDVDPVTLAVRGTIDLGARNPFGRVVTDASGALWFAAPGDFYSSADVEAGIVRFDPSTRTPKIVTTEAALGGSVAQVAISADGTCGAAIVADASSLNRTWLTTFDPRSGAIGKVVLGPTHDYNLHGLAWAWADSTLLVGDGTRGSSGYPVHVMVRSGACELAPREDIVLALPPLAFGP